MKYPVAFLLPFTYPGSFDIWCWRRLEKSSWTDRIRNEVLRSVNVDRNMLNTLKTWKANWIGYIMRRNCLLKHVIEGKIEEVQK
jgi:hypothetical protein